MRYKRIIEHFHVLRRFVNGANVKNISHSMRCEAHAYSSNFKTRMAQSAEDRDYMKARKRLVKEAAEHNREMIRGSRDLTSRFLTLMKIISQG